MNTPINSLPFVDDQIVIKKIEANCRGPFTNET